MKNNHIESILKKSGMQLSLVKDGDKFRDILNGNISILPEELKNKPADEINLSDEICRKAHEWKRAEYQRKLNYQIDNLIFLTGAGSSYEFGTDGKKGLLMSGLWNKAEDILEGEDNMTRFCSEVKYTDKDKEGKLIKNLETVLSLAEIAKDFVADWTTGEGVEAKEWSVSDIICKIKTMIKTQCNLVLDPNNSSVHEMFLNKITKRKSSLPRVKLFTLNYDTLFEQAAKKGNHTVIDGFSFSLPREFSGRYFDYDLVIRDRSRIKGEDNFASRVFHLYKPHGSVDWKRHGNRIIQENADTIEVEDSLMIFPQENKYEHSYDQPFFEMMTRFQFALRAPNTTLVTIGFSFGDKHILSMIKEALEQNPGFQLIIVNYDPSGIKNDTKFYEEASNRHNVIIVNETFEDFVEHYPDNEVYDQSQDQYRLIKVDPI